MSSNVWSDGYLNIPWKWGGETRNGCDCLGIVKLALKEQCNKFLEGNSPEKIDDNYDMFHKAVEVGAQVEDIKDLKEFDMVFFTIRGEVTHMGIMVNKFGYFLHQLLNKPSRTSNLNNDYWRKRFFCGIRLSGL